MYNIKYRMVSGTLRIWKPTPNETFDLEAEQSVASNSEPYVTEAQKFARHYA